MRAPQIVRDFLEWRWAPCVALTAGSLAYVGFAVLLIPSQIDGGSRTSDLPASFDRSATLPNTAFAASLTQNSPAAPPTVHEPMHRSPPPAPNDPVGVPRRGFSPPIEQPDPPPPPPPPPSQPVQAAPPPMPQPVVNVPPPQPPADQPATPAPPPPPANGDDSTQPPPATQ
jgi:outer membrane biosynthesis protein TonB